LTDSAGFLVNLTTTFNYCRQYNRQTTEHFLQEETATRGSCPKKDREETTVRLVKMGCGIFNRRISEHSSEFILLPSLLGTQTQNRTSQPKIQSEGTGTSHARRQKELQRPRIIL